MAPRPGSSQDIANYLTTGYWTGRGTTPHSWDMSADNVVTVNLSALTPDGQALARAALDAWEMVADIQFREVAGSANIAFDDDEPGSNTSVRMSGGDLISAQVNIGTDWLARYGTTIGSYSYQTYVHEIGHALGLGHSGAYNGGASYANATFTTDSWQQTVMSYLDQDENPTVAATKAYVLTPMMADVLAVQTLYGRPVGGATAGDTTWGVGGTTGTYLDGMFRAGGPGLANYAMTVFDEGGVDGINLSSDTRAQVVSLVQGSFSNVYGEVGNLAIAQGTIVENYVAGSGNDGVTGNNAGNRLTGGAGDDRLLGALGNDSAYGGIGADDLFGGDGSDWLEGGDGNDDLYGDAGDDNLLGVAGADTVYGSLGRDTVDGGAGNDFLYGQDGNDTLRGGSEVDRLDGGVGSDTLWGGIGADNIVFGGGQDVLMDFENNVDTIRLDDALWGGRVLGVAGVLGYASVVAGDVLFDFGGGRSLRIEGLASVDALLDDITIF